MSDKNKTARTLFLGDYNCAQSTLAVFSEELEIDKEQALAIASGFGAGLGYQGLTCGVVTGAYMALGLYSGKNFNEPEMVKENAYQLIQEFNKRFKSKFGTIACKELIGTDLSTAEGLERGKNSGVFESKCPEFVEAAVEIVAQLQKK